MLKVSANLRNGQTEKKIERDGQVDKILDGQTDKNWKRLAEGQKVEKTDDGYSWKTKTLRHHSSGCLLNLNQFAQFQYIKATSSALKQLKEVSKCRLYNCRDPKTNLKKEKSSDALDYLVNLNTGVVGKQTDED